MEQGAAGIRITERGILYIDRGYGEQKIYCIHHHGIPCGEWCALFGVREIEKRDDIQIVKIPLCENREWFCRRETFIYEKEND